MKAPLARGHAITPKRRRGWQNLFAAYKSPVIEQGIVDWIEQFSDEDRDLAARILDVVDFYSVPRIHAAFRDTLAALPGWSKDARKRRGKWRFCEYSSSAGSSAGAMLNQFKYANGLTGPQARELFIARSEIPGARLGPDDSLVLVDDFMGTGAQAKEAFAEFFQELVGGAGSVYLITVAARQVAMDAVLEATGLEVRAGNILTAADSPLDKSCRHFTDQERDRLVEYGRRADKRQPGGFGECGLVVVFQHNCPNNSLAILHAQSKRWTPLFPRH